MRRFFLPTGSLAGETITLTGAEAGHIVRVLRLRPGQAVEFFDGRGGIVAAVLTGCEPRLVTATVTGRRQEDTAVGGPLTLAQALLKGRKMDFIVQKATELGVHTLVPVRTRYCENRGDRDNQQERWQRILIEACKQCHRAEPLRILPVTPLTTFDCDPAAHLLAAWEGEQHAALPAGLASAPLAPVCLFLGPEGGLHADDLRMLDELGFTTFSLGPRILRGETATLAAVAIVQYLTGSLRPVDSGGPA
ncbi:MAG: RsmE family RNA methyltransferase [Desulfobulbus sp.]|nr:RsmE family RNA methyltransferase [Desulfobulbus sp.]